MSTIYAEDIEVEEDVSDDERPLFADLSPHLDGSFQQELPTIGESWNGTALFYAGRINEVHAEPSVGKTNVLMAVCITEIQRGGKVLYIDPEDTPIGFVNRMRAFGASVDNILQGVFYLHNPSADQIHKAHVWAVENQPEIVVLDGLAESLVANEMNEDSAGDVLRYFRQYIRPFAETGAAVLIADHVKKSTEGRGIFARGSGAKAGRYDGVSYEILDGKPYTPIEEGFVKLKVAKDRNGGVGPKGKVVAELHFIHNPSGGTITAFREPKQKQDGPFRPTYIMEKIVEHLKIHGEATTTELRNLTGKTESINLGVNLLKQERVIDTRKEGAKTLHFLLPNGSGKEAAPCSQVVPSSSQEQLQPCCSLVPTPYRGEQGEHDGNTLHDDEK